MIGGLLDIHKMEEGNLAPDKKTTNLVELIDDVVEKFIPKAAAKKYPLFLKGPMISPISRLTPVLLKGFLQTFLATPSGIPLTAVKLKLLRIHFMVTIAFAFV